jgi:N-glycosylase/DNA lyase
VTLARRRQAIFTCFSVKFLRTRDISFVYHALDFVLSTARAMRKKREKKKRRNRVHTVAPSSSLSPLKKIMCDFV